MTVGENGMSVFARKQDNSVSTLACQRCYAMRLKDEEPLASDPKPATLWLLSQNSKVC